MNNHILISHADQLCEVILESTDSSRGFCVTHGHTVTTNYRCDGFHSNSAMWADLWRDKIHQAQKEEAVSSFKQPISFKDMKIGMKIFFFRRAITDMVVITIKDWIKDNPELGFIAESGIRYEYMYYNDKFFYLYDEDTVILEKLNEMNRILCETTRGFKERVYGNPPIR